jgi:hypothetical protein
MFSDNNPIIENLIKEGRYDEVIKYISQKDKEVGFSEDLYNDKMIENNNISFNGKADAVNMTNITYIDNVDGENENLNDVSYAPTEIGNNYDYINKYYDILKEDNPGNEIIRNNNIDEKMRLFQEEDYQNLIKEEEDNSRKIIQLQEIYEMNLEEINGRILQKSVREKLFPYLNLNLSDNLFSDVLNSNDFKNMNIIEQQFSISSEKYFSEKDLHSTIKQKNYNKEINQSNSLVNEIIMNSTINKKSNDNAINRLNKLNKRIIHPNNNDTSIKSKITESNNKNSKKIRDFFRSSVFADKINLLDSSEYQSFSYPQKESIYINTNKYLSNEHNFEPILLNVTHNLLYNEKNIYQIEEERIHEKIKIWNKNFNLINSDNNELDTKNINFKRLNGMLLNFYTKFNVNMNMNMNQTASSNFTRKNFFQKNNNNNIIIELTLTGNNLNKIPAEILNKSPHLRFLNFEENQIDRIENFNDCKNLISLNLNKNNIYKIENLESLSNLERLSLNGNNIMKLENLSANRKLKNLSLGRNKIKSIENVENEILLIEELTLCENQIKVLPVEMSFPYLKYLDLNENKIKNLNGLFLCPSLEKILLKDNKITLIEEECGNYVNNFHTYNFHPPLKHCGRLKEIDLSFNKIEYFSSVLHLLNYNNKLEVINLINNPLSLNLKGIIELWTSLKRIFPRLKTVNNEYQEDTTCPTITHKYSSNNYDDCDDSFLNTNSNIFHLQNIFIKNFNAIYLSTNIFDRFNFNSNLNLNSFENIEKFQFIDMLNENFYKFKKHNLSTLGDFIFKSNSNGAINKYSDIQFQFMRYLYTFKHKIEFLSNSIDIFKVNHSKRKVKIKFLQNHIKCYFHHKHFMEKLKNVKFDDDDGRDADNLINFFEKGDNNFKVNLFEQSFDMEKDEIKMISNNPITTLNTVVDLNNNIKTHNNNFEEKHNDNYIEIHNINIHDYPAINTYTASPPVIVEFPKNSTNINIHTQNEKSLQSPPNHINKENIHNIIHSSHNIKIPPVRQRGNFRDIENNFNIISLNDQAKLNYLPSINEKNIINPKYNIDIPQINKPNSNVNTNPHSNSIKPLTILPVIKNDLQLSTSSISSITSNSNKNSSSHSHKQNSSLKKQKIPSSTSSNHNTNTHTNSNLAYHNSGRLIPTKILDKIKLIEEECRLAIKKAKEDWQFTNDQADELLENKIKKQYRKKIDKLLQGGG